MKITGNPKTRNAEQLFSSVAIIVLVLILPHIGGAAMVAGSAVVMCVYTFYFKEIMRDRRGSLVPAICLTSLVVLAAVVVIVISLIRGHWD